MATIIIIIVKQPELRVSKNPSPLSLKMSPIIKAITSIPIKNPILKSILKFHDQIDKHIAGNNTTFHNYNST